MSSFAVVSHFAKTVEPVETQTDFSRDQASLYEMLMKSSNAPAMLAGLELPSKKSSVRRVEGSIICPGGREIVKALIEQELSGGDGFLCSLKLAAISS